MEDTCNYKECKLFDLLGGTQYQCPNYVEGWWQPQEGEPKLIKDCSPKRLLLMMRNLEIRFLGVQQSNEEQRNESNKIMENFSKIVNAAYKKYSIDLEKDPDDIQIEKYGEN